jgi:endogenous inhibitor of DNA gyrase (YacG/DUF329 family)
MTAPCPICRKPAEAAYAPFCSKRCADVDLSRWLKGSYAIPGPVAEEDTKDALMLRNGPELLED